MNFDDTTLNANYDDRNFQEVLACVIGKMLYNEPLMGAKEELMDDFIREWTELFGWSTL